jgi:predicted PurR-regulated permease PerM
MAALKSQARLNRWVALLGVTLLTVYLSWKVLEPFVEVLILGVALTMIFQPMHRRFVAWSGGQRRGAVCSTIFTLLVLVVPFTFVSITVLRELPGAVNEVRTGIATLQEQWDASADEGGWLATIRKEWRLDEFFSEQKIKEYTDKASGFVFQAAFVVGGGVMGFLVNFIFLLFVLFFLFRDGDRLAARVVEFLPLPREQSRALIRRLDEVLAGCVYGVLMVAAVQGTLGGIAFWALGLKSPVTWGLVMTLLCTLPIVGAWLVWLPAAVYLALHGDYARAIILALVGQFVISSIDGLLRPILVGQRAKLHELVIFFSVLGGLKYFGLLGILLGPIIMSLAYGLVTILWQAQNHDNSAPEHPSPPSPQPPAHP